MANYTNNLGQIRLGWRTAVSTTPVNTNDVDATTFITAAGITDSTQISALNTLVTDLKTYGLWTKMKAIYPFVGGTASSHKFNLKDPRDLDAAYRLVFTGGWTHTSTGSLPNGTNAAADTKLIPTSSLINNNTHISFYSRTQNTSLNAVNIGCYDFTTEIALFQYYNGNSSKGVSMYEYPANAAYVNNTNTLGFQIGSRTSSTSLKLYFNNLLLSTNTANNVKSQPTISISIGASTRPVGFNQYAPHQSAFASIGDGLTDTEASNFYISVQKFQTTLGRHVGTPYVSDPDAIAFLMAAGITDGTQAAAINTLVIRMKADGVWTKMKAIYPFVGGSAASHKFNLKDPRDLDAAFRLVFNGGWVHSSTGALPNGTNGYADTKFNPNSQSMSLSSFHLSNYARTAMTSGTSRVYMGVESLSTSDITLLGWVNNGTQEGGSIGGTNTGTQYSPSPALSPSTAGFKTLLTNGNRNARFFRNGAYQSNQVLQTYNSPNYNLYLSAINRDSLTAGAYNNTEQAFASIGDGLTDAEAANFYTAVQAFQTTLGRQVNVPLVSDTDAQSFLNAANITSFQQASAVNKLVVDLKAAGVWTKMKAIYPFVGGSAASHKFNLKDPRDLDAAFRLVFNGGWTHTGTGALPNGTTGYADTKLTPLTHLLDANHHYTYYSRSNGTPANEVEIGSSSMFGYYSAHMRLRLDGYYGVTNKFTIALNGSNTYIDTSYTNTDSRGFYQGQVTSTSSRKLYKNGINVTHVTQNSPLDRSPWRVFIGSMNEENVAKFFSKKETAFVSIGDGLTDLESAALYTAVETYQTSLGRGVNTPIYNNGLVLNLDAGNANSYPGTGTTWFDLASGNNGTLVNGPTYDVNNGGSLYFDGTNDYGNFGNIQSLNSLTSGVTVGAWIKSSTTTTYSAILQKWYQAGVQGGFQLYISPGGVLSLAIGDYISSYGGCNSTVSVITGSWIYVTATYDMNSMKIYINGVLNSTNSFIRSVVNSNNATLYVGQDDYGGRFFRGNISSATVHNRALSATEILNNFNSTRGRFGL